MLKLDCSLNQKIENLAKVLAGFKVRTGSTIKKIQYGDVIAYLVSDSIPKVEYYAVNHVYGEDSVKINLLDLEKTKAFVSLVLKH